MKALAVTLILGLSILGSVVARPASAEPALRSFHPGTGLPNPGRRAERSMWSEPPDLNGLIGSSEQILEYGLETEIANDFVPSDSLIAQAAFWGGYYNNDFPCHAGIPTPGFHFRFYREYGACNPSTTPFADITITHFIEEPIGCQQGFYPIYKWTGDVNVPVVPGTTYWFSAQFADHTFPPQGGRLASMSVVGCGSMFLTYWDWPEWEPVIDVFGVDADFSQEFNGARSSAPAACCLPEGRCSILSPNECASQAGTWLGSGTVCDSNPCAIGACCAGDGTCTIAREADCPPPSAWQGIGTTCLSNTCGMRGPGATVCWGANWAGQCAPPDPNRNFTAIAAGGAHTLGLEESGSVVAWGEDDFHQIDVPTPNADFIAIAGGANHSLGLKSSGVVVGWGQIYDGQIYVPAPNHDFTAIAAGGNHSLGLKMDGSIRAWGSNIYHESNVPSPNANFIAVAAGENHSLGLEASGSIVAWGRNYEHQCDVPYPNADFVAIAASAHHSLALKADGTVIAWGDDTLGQCDVPSPNAGFVAIAAGFGHSLALRTDGSIVGWGYNGDGECNVPSPNSGFLALCAGSSHSVGLTRLPRVACCLPNASCIVTTPDDCIAMGGTTHGEAATCESNPCGASSVDGGAALPAVLSLRASPNPSHGSVLLLCDLPRPTAVRVEIVNAAGSIVWRLDLGPHDAGRYSIPWDGRDNDGRRLPAGVYMTRISTREGSASGRLIILGR